MDTVMQPMLKFGPCLRQMLGQKGISASELARRMAYKSRNSIFRILDGVGGDGPRRAFFERLIAEDPLALNEEERKRLAQALEISRVGQSAFLANRAMRELLSDRRTKTCGARVDASFDPHDSDFHRTIASMLGGKRAELTITGCCDRAIFEALRERIGRPDVVCELHITHFIYTGEEEIVRNISAIQPLLYSDFYDAYCVQPGVFSKEREAIYRGNSIFVHAQDAQGDWYGQQLVLVDKGVFVPMQRLSGDERSPFSRLFALDTSKTPPLKATFAPGATIADYVRYTQDCLTLEQNRAMYTIKADVPICFVPTGILETCLRDDVCAQMTPEGVALEEMIAAFARIHSMRFENHFQKRKETHIIFSQWAMERFARTGRQLDHPFAFRPYTGEQCVAILSHLRRHAQENPCFHIYFFRADFEPLPAEVGFFEGAGTLMAKPCTDYDLSGDHAEAIITQEAFCAHYKAFFIDDLLAKHVLTQQETLDMLDRLIDIARQTQRV